MTNCGIINLLFFENYIPEFINAFLPANLPSLPNSSSILIRRLNFASRSLLQPLPVFNLPADVATAKSAMKVSSVSPLRFLT